MVTSDTEWQPLDFEPLGDGKQFRVLLVYPNIQAVKTPQMGLAIISACLKRIGATVELLDTTRVKHDAVADELESRVRNMNPNLIAYGVRSMEWPLAKSMLIRGKTLHVPQIVGGPHATTAPEEVIPHVDALVMGEGEGAIMDIVRRLASSKPLAGIANTWANTSTGIVKTEARNLIPNLDDIPMPDWKIFDDIHYKDSYAAPFPGFTGILGPIEGSRGCPYTCTYCSNGAQMKAHRGKGKWRREKSPERIVEELRTFREVYGQLDFVFAVDEIWLTRTDRVARFAELYKREIGVPFRFMERAECITEDKIRLIAEAGVQSIAIGLESGDPELRRNVLDRRTTDATLLRAFTLPQKYGIQVHAFNMLGLPGQDTESMLKTWRFMRRILPDTAQFTIFYPLRGTPLHDRVVAEKLYDPADTLPSYYVGSVLKQEGLDDEILLRYQKLLTTYAVRKGVWPVIAFHFYRTVPMAYRLRFHRIPAALRSAAYFWRRLIGLRHYTPRQAFRKILYNIIPEKGSKVEPNCANGNVTQ